jgi:hypothetical protein
MKIKPLVKSLKVGDKHIMSLCEKIVTIQVNEGETILTIVPKDYYEDKES